MITIVRLDGQEVKCKERRTPPAVKSSGVLVPRIANATPHALEKVRKPASPVLQPCQGTRRRLSRWDASGRPKWQGCDFNALAELEVDE